MSEQYEGQSYPGPLPEGVQHGPYPKTEAHPFDQSNGHANAIDEARDWHRIGEDNAQDLQDNLATLSVLEYAENSAIKAENPVVEPRPLTNRENKY